MANRYIAAVALSGFMIIGGVGVSSVFAYPTQSCPSIGDIKQHVLANPNCTAADCIFSVNDQQWTLLSTGSTKPDPSTIYFIYFNGLVILEKDTPYYHAFIAICSYSSTASIKVFWPPLSLPFPPGAIIKPTKNTNSSWVTVEGDSECSPDNGKPEDCQFTMESNSK